MAHVIVGRKADREHVRIIVLPELFVGDGLFGKRDEQFVKERRVIEGAVERGAGLFRAARHDVGERAGVAPAATDHFPGRRIRPGAF